MEKELVKLKKYDIHTPLKKFKNFFSLLEEVHFERSSVIHKLQLALLTKEHLLIEGPPGTGKSYLADSVFSCISGAETYSKQFSEFMSEDHLIGPVNPKILREFGHIEHNVEKTFVTCNFAFLDEVMDASDSVLRGHLLGILNERKFINGRQILDCPLHTAIMTTNFNRQSDQALEAIYDRIIFKEKITNINRLDNRVNMFRSYLSGEQRFDDLYSINLSLDDITKIANFVIAPRSITIPHNIMNTYSRLKEIYYNLFRRVISDRTMNKGLQILKATALLDTRLEVTSDDLRVVELMWISDSESSARGKFSSAVTKEIDNISKARDMQKSLSEMREELASMEVVKTTPHKNLAFYVQKLLKLDARIETELGKKSIEDNFSLQQDYQDLKKLVKQKQSLINDGIGV